MGKTFALTEMVRKIGCKIKPCIWIYKRASHLLIICGSFMPRSFKVGCHKEAWWMFSKYSAKQLTCCARCFQAHLWGGDEGTCCPLDVSELHLPSAGLTKYIILFFLTLLLENFHAVEVWHAQLTQTLFSFCLVGTVFSAFQRHIETPFGSLQKQQLRCCLSHLG